MVTPGGDKNFGTHTLHAILSLQSFATCQKVAAEYFKAALSLHRFTRVLSLLWNVYLQLLTLSTFMRMYRKALLRYRSEYRFQNVKMCHALFYDLLRPFMAFYPFSARFVHVHFATQLAS